MAKKSSPGISLDDIKASFARNKSLRDCNPDLLNASTVPAKPLLAPETPIDPVNPKKAGKKRREMNNTEAEFSKILDREIAVGRIISFEYEQITLRFGDLTYTPDFTVMVEEYQDTFRSFMRIRFVEVKGPHIWPKDMVRFKAAKHAFPHFDFEMWQKKNREWTQLF